MAGASPSSNVVPAAPRADRPNKAPPRHSLGGDGAVACPGPGRRRPTVRHRESPGPETGHCPPGPDSLRPIPPGSGQRPCHPPPRSCRVIRRPRGRVWHTPTAGSDTSSVLAAAADTLGPACPSLVGLQGQPSAAALTLLRRLQEHGATLRYRGDFDWGVASHRRSPPPPRSLAARALLPRGRVPQPLTSTVTTRRHPDPDPLGTRARHGRRGTRRARRGGAGAGAACCPTWREVVDRRTGPRPQRASVERGIARLNSWRIFGRSRCSPDRLTSVTEPSSPWSGNAEEAQ